MIHKRTGTYFPMQWNSKGNLRKVYNPDKDIRNQTFHVKDGDMEDQVAVLGLVIKAKISVRMKTCKGN